MTVPDPEAVLDALQKLDGTDAAAVSLLTGISRADLDGLGGIESTACTAIVCSKECQEFIPGRKFGRDTEPSCGTCTHTRASHQPLRRSKKVKRG